MVGRRLGDHRLRVASALVGSPAEVAQHRRHHQVPARLIAQPSMPFQALFSGGRKERPYPPAESHGNVGERVVSHMEEPLWWAGQVLQNQVVEVALYLALAIGG